MNLFTYDIPTKVYFDENQLTSLSEELQKLGKRVLLCYDDSIKKVILYDQVVAEIKRGGLKFFEFSGIGQNPQVNFVREGARICKEKQIDAILVIGDGWVVDCVKFISLVTFYEGGVIEEISVKEVLPIVSIMEMKKGLEKGHPYLKAGESLLESATSLTISRYQTACASIDILYRLFEIYFINNETEKFLNTMERLMKIVIKYVPLAMERPDDDEAHANLMWVRSWVLNNLLDSHQNRMTSLEHELSAFYDITHGLGLAFLVPVWMNYVLDKRTVDRFYCYGINVWSLDPKMNKRSVAKQAIEKTSAFFFETLGLDKSVLMP